MPGRPRTDAADSDIIESLSIIIHTTRGEMPIRAVSPRALNESAADARQFALTASSFTIEPAPFDAAKLPTGWTAPDRRDP